ncbi:Short-chain dehydrogenase [Palleronia marisminoris]|uniref:SDR family oxidoreductase n=1 Tax=Palleronia marisminoris TaxID=315423 RepID=UPI0008EFCAB7|nr:SDR family oxidoreductase [Palleronia marisminoris]SFH26975.1 Short-chain dehydrogenase [Palleronia marisminoris]
MEHRYKPLDRQTIVVTGASSGIGLATARRAARSGAQVVLASRSEEALRKICDEINNSGPGRAVYAVADVGDEVQVQNIAEVAVKEFGGFDTWINDAGVVVFAELRKLPTKDHERLFQTNYFGIVFGSLTAVEHMRNRLGGGTIINIASTNADMPVPILGGYSATKAAVKAFSDVLRMELLEQDIPVAVSVVKPSGIATPISEHGLSHMEDRGKVMPPLYDPEVVARTILAAAQRPVRNITVGGTGRFTSIARSLVPGLADRAIGWLLPRVQSTGLPKMPDSNLHSAGEDGQVYLSGQRQGLRASPYTRARLHPNLAVGATIGLAALFLMSQRRR